MKENAFIRLLGAVMACFMLFGSLPAFSFADAAEGVSEAVTGEPPGVLMASNGTCGESLTWFLADGILTISGTGAMQNYSYSCNSYAVDSPWYSLRSIITGVVIQPGVTAVGSYAFYDCRNLTDVTIPEGVTSIGDGAFQACFRIPKVTLPGSVTAIGNEAFFLCDSLTALRYNGTREQWSGVAIGSGNEQLTGADITFADLPTRPASIRMVLPGHLTTVKTEAFAGNIAMTSVEIPASVTAIESGAFSGSGLSIVVFDGSAPIIAPDAFTGVTATMYYPANDANWTASTMQGYGGNLTWAAYTK